MIWLLIGALCYRIKGGLLDQIVGRELPNTLNRSIWALTVTIKLTLASGFWLVSPLIFITSFLGVAWGYFGQFDLALPKNRTRRNYFLLTLDGMCVMLPTAALMSVLGYHSVWFGVIAGASFVPCYLAGNHIYKYCKIQGWTQYGELLLGFCIMGALCLNVFISAWETN